MGKRADVVEVGSGSVFVDLGLSEPGERRCERGWRCR